MSIFCTLNRNSSFEKTEYRVIDASHGFASIEKRNPAWTEDPSAFDVPVMDIAVIWREDEFGRVVITRDEEEALHYPHLM